MTDQNPTTAAADLAECVRQFVYWVSANEFTDPDHMLVCAEWNALCAAYRERNPS